MIDYFKKYLKTNNQLSIINCQYGFTMVELLLYMGIFSILLIVLLQLFSGILATHTESQATSSVDQDGNFLLARLAYDIHNASSITSPVIGNSCTWTTGSTTPCQLILSNGTYTAQSDNLTFTANGNTDQLNSIDTKITSITFSTYGNNSSSCSPNCKPSIQISLTLQSKTVRQGGHLQTQSFQTTVATR